MNVNLLAGYFICFSTFNVSISKGIGVFANTELKFKIVDAIKEYALNNNYNIDTTDGVKVIKTSSWGLLRASNTGPNLTLRFEATTKKELKQIQKEFMDVLSKIMNK